MEENNMRAAGPGSIEESGVAPKPLLEGATEYEVVTVFNPLAVSFIGMVGQSKPVSMPFEVRKDGITQTVSNDERSVLSNYGLNLKNQDHPSLMPIVNRVEIPSGQTRKLLGNEAQVIVRQLVNEILQREGKRLMLADPTARHEVELRIVRGRQSVEEAIGSNPLSVQTQIREGMNKLNEQENETEFPDLQSTPASEEPHSTGGDSGSETATRKRRARAAA